MLDRAEAAQVFQIVDLDVPVVDLIAALTQEIAHHVLARPFRTAGRRNRDKIPRRGQLRVEIGVHGIKDFLPAIDSVIASLFPLSARASDNQIILCRGICRRFRSL